MKLVTNEKLEELLAASPAERVTKEYMESRIANTEFHRLGETVTIAGDRRANRSHLGVRSGPTR